MTTTGRKFRCIGLHESRFTAWRRFFEVSKEYEEMAHPEYPMYGDAREDGIINDNSIYLKSNDGCCVWVDSNQFIRVRESHFYAKV